MPSGKRETERKGNAPVNTGPSPNSDGRANNPVEEAEEPARAYSQSQEGVGVWVNWGADEFRIAHVTSSGSLIEFFADLELEYNGGVENDEQTLPYGIAPLSERLFHLLNAVILL
ncbi:hypothetical protein T01_8566 [Trichinella spiralis]|uniref:Uncharacterized protein n=1 Tax=Trichinella spiralis TaxID=6334 RepID=A0A0V1BZ66_TRISP|nr:hypothetical protein T01_8566 [Trichinella spiralis]